MKKRKTLGFVVLLLIASLVLAACTQVERAGRDIIMFGYSYDDDVPPIVSIENEYLRLDFLTATAEIVVTCRITGDQWRSTPEGAADLPLDVAAPIARFHMQSMFLLTYENERGNSVPLDGYRFARRTGRYEHAIVDGGLELYFTIGDIPDTFYIPLAIYSERFYEFIDQMEPAQRRQMLEAYRVIRLDRLRPTDNRSELVEEFPTLEDGRHIYVLRDNIRPHLQSRMQGYLQNVGYDTYEWIADMQYFGQEVDLNRPAFNLTMRFELEGNNMIVSVPFDEINHSPSFLPTGLTIMPFFGAGHVEDEGYLFVPDGPGALIHFDSGRFGQGVYFNRVFGWDYAILRDHLIHDNVATYPVFGSYVNGATFVGIIEQGASYASIRAEAGGPHVGMGGATSPFSAVHPVFRLIHGAPMDVIGRSDRPFFIHEYGLAEGESIVIRYVFPTTPGYVGMAVAYREFLQARYPWLNNRVSEPVNAMVEFLGAAETRQHILGFPVDRPVALTSFSQAEDMMTQFNDLGWENLHIMMRGAHNDSIDHSVPTSLSLVSQLGNRRAFDSMVNAASSFGFEFYLEGDFVNMRGNSMFNGFSGNRDAARQVNRQRVQWNGFSTVYFGELGSANVLADPVILARPAFTIDLITNFVDQASRINVNNIAFRSIANNLAGDFNEDRHVTREASMHMRAELLYDLRAQGTGIWLNHGFSYAMPFASVITGMPITDQGFGITDTVVPFYQIALHGLIPFAGRPINLAEDHSYHLLRSIESGSSLFFSFMDVSTADLEVTRYRRYFANEFGRWIDVANDLYHNHVSNFGHLYNQLIVDHQLLGQGVTVTVYEDGTRVYVNTTMVDFDNGSVSVPARRYTVVRGGR